MDINLNLAGFVKYFYRFLSFSLVISIFAAPLYVGFELPRVVLCSLLAEKFCFPEVAGASLTSILEVAIGFNLALSMLEAVSSRIVSGFKRHIDQYTSDPTFSESIREAMENFSKDTNVQLDAAADINSRLQENIRAGKAMFDNDVSKITSYSKSLGLVASFGFFCILVAIAGNQDLKVPYFIFCTLCLSVLSPLFIHLLGVSVQLVEYRILMFNGAMNNQNGQAYKGFVRDVFGIYHRRKKLIDRVDLVGR